MITKLTAENSGLYYAPAFELINQALEAAGNSLRVNSLEEYFNNLTSDIIPLLVNKHIDNDGNEVGIPGGYLLLMPADEEIFSIDANTRAISIPAKIKKNGVGVYGDHNAEMLVLDIDRYFDNQDLLNTNVAINWNFIPAGARNPKDDQPYTAVAAFAPNADINPEKVTFGFIINKDMTPSKGTLIFSVTFYTTESDVITYSLNTLTASVAINDTLTLTDPKMVYNDIDNYLGRFTNSVYYDNTVSAVNNPIWKSGTYKNGIYSGLDEKAYFASYEDLANNYREGALLKAYAMVDPNTANISYKWTVNPLDGTVAMGRDFYIENRASDYIEVNELTEDQGEIYYIKDSIGHVDTAHPLTFAEAQAVLADESNNLDYLPIKIKKLDEAPDDLNNEKSQFNQDHIVLSASGNIIIVKSTTDLNNFESTNSSQGNGQWIGFDIDTGLATILAVKWNGSELTTSDVEEASSVNLPSGHIIFWAKAESLLTKARTITLSADGYQDTQFTIQYIGVDPEVIGNNKYLSIINGTETKKIVVNGTSFRALYAGTYQVFAQAHTGNGSHYEKVLENAFLKAGVQYFKKINDEIDKDHPLINEQALQAQEAGEDLYVLVSSSKNSEVIASSVLTIPPAVQPKVKLEVESKYEFNEEVMKDPDASLDKNYTYIDDDQFPTIVATVSFDETSDAQDKAGAIAVELVKSDAAPLTKESIEKPESELEFGPLPVDGKFRFTPTKIETGEYLVRAINRRNGTYSVSDLEHTDKIYTSFVAPVVDKISVEGTYWDYGTERPVSGFQDMLIDGQRVDNEIKILQIGSEHPRCTYNVINNTQIDGTKYDLTGPNSVQISYEIEEVSLNKEGMPISRTEEKQEGLDKNGDLYGQEDLREIVIDENGIGTFDIDNDSGYYRIKTTVHYNGTIRIIYSDIFGVSKM